MEILTLHVHGINYHIRIEGQGEPLVLLHGFTGSAASWDDSIAYFAQHYRVIAIDLLGHGDTDAPTSPERYTIQAAARDLDSIFQSLLIPNVYLLGYSMGGRLALYFALAYPQRIKSLILESASAGLETEQERAARIISDEMLASRLETNGIRQFVDYWENIPLFTSQQGLDAHTIAKQREIRLKQNPIGLAGSLRGIGTGKQPSLWGRLKEIKAPVLLITGALDIKFTTINHNMQAQIETATHITILKAGHTPHLEQPAEFHAKVSEFLNSR
jgi:2-succinyl-6-hydroxy-2,4-cyclohexadiene-1-carboxylate synthase